jgi:hypothetical protein
MYNKSNLSTRLRDRSANIMGVLETSKKMANETGFAAVVSRSRK